MEVIKGFENLSPLSGQTVIAIGNFDGIHLGHQRILHILKKKANKHNLLSLVLTFFPHPEKILGKKRVKLIQTLDQRLEELEKFNIQTALVVPFNEKFSSLSSQDFIREFVVMTLRAKILIVGENFRFGKNREGDPSLLRRLSSQLNFDLCSIPSVTKEGMIVSSSLIRNLLMKGKIEQANMLLGRFYGIEGKVKKGKSRGKAIGFPTANIETKNEIIPPGVFVTRVRVNSQSLPSLTNVGICPTFKKKEINIESYIIHFKKNIYREKIRLYFIKKIRDEMEFKTPEELSQQIKKDVKIAKAHFGFK